PQFGRGARTVDGHRAALELDLARVDGVDAGDALDEGGLPCAVVADEGHHLAAPHREVHVVQHMDGAEALVEPGQAEDGVSVFSHVVPSSRFRSCPWRAPERPGFPGTRGALSGAGPATR